MKQSDKATLYATLIDHCTAYVQETKPTVNTPAATYHLMAPLCMEDMQEGVYVILLNSKNRPINAPVRITHGLANASMIHPREVFRLAITSNAVSIILAHNHPSGDPTPSQEDIRMTQNICDAGEIIGIHVTDHVIIGKPSNDHPGFFSMRESGLANFT